MQTLARSSEDGWTSYISLGGLTSLSIGGILYILSLVEDSRALQIRDIVCYEHLGDVLKLKGLLPLLVAIRGRVYSTHAKKCELSDKHAVVHEIVEEEIWRKTRENGRVVNEPLEIKRSSERSEWFLEDGISPVRVKVDNVLQAERLGSVLQVTQVFVPEDHTKNTIARMIIDKTWQMSKLGVRKTERYLPLGAVVTVIGQLEESVLAREPGAAYGTDTTTEQQAEGQMMMSGTSSNPLAYQGFPPSEAVSSSASPLSTLGLQSTQSPASSTQSPASSSSTQSARTVTTAGSGTSVPTSGLLLRRPAAGNGAFIITPLTLDQLHESMSSTSRVYKYAALGFGAVGMALIMRKLLVRLARSWRELQTRKRLDQIREQRKMEMSKRTASHCNSGATDGSTEAALGGGNTRDKDDDDDDERMSGTCVVCIDRPVQMVFTSCGHMCCCEGCGVRLLRCPVCRLRGSPIKVYQP
ncbi:hypothetical protein CEUSTIGMA_g9660.t1 [Chlamydomonas eustigma]|uniref:RING-type E3 ubiquitin transferase n=1 Tax=Chlamydomonas eustigma TaxID=1157962 RepID=A0A250XH37_9CHLO|nr:hypothetical protein CEUSTIGMA_g9660.t1 [Chlamydomonas eustigma]|eukprot:GAX82232.1 hypothetical protein CEUSTIGMA_g9660.t1 [Chlamydomonas eustigma]